MVRNYKRKTITAVNNEGMSIRKAAEVFAVPTDALHRRVKNKLKLLTAESMHKKVLAPIRQALTPEQEGQLVEQIKKMESCFYGLTIIDPRRVVYENKIVHPFNKELKMAGVNFVYNFLKILLRKPQGVSIIRVYGVNRESVELYFQNLKSFLNNMGYCTKFIVLTSLDLLDESGLTCVHKSVKMLAERGKHCVLSITSEENGITTTVALGVFGAKTNNFC